MRAFAIFLGLTIGLGLFGSSGWAVVTSPGAPAIASSLSSAPVLMAQAESDAVRRPVPQVGTVPSKKIDKPAATGPVIIPEPPPFPNQDGNAHLYWAIAGAAVILVALILLIVLMVRRDATKKRSNKSRKVELRARNKGGLNTINRDGNTTISTHTISNTTGLTNSPTIGQTTGLAPDDQPLNIIKTQWQDIQTNSGSFPNLDIEMLDVDSEIRDSFREEGYNPFYSMPTSGIEVAEHTDSLSEAEALIQMGFDEQAIHLIERMMADNEHPKPKVWLMLFDLYVRTGAEEKYTQLAQGFVTYFNAAVPNWAGVHSHRPEFTKPLEDYPGVINKLVRVWNSPACETFLETLIYDNRNGTRGGFSLAAYNDIIFLAEVLQTIKAGQTLPFVDKTKGLS